MTMKPFFVVKLLYTFRSRTINVDPDICASGLDVVEVSRESKTPATKSRKHFCIHKNVNVHTCINIRFGCLSKEKFKEGVLTDLYKTYVSV